MPIYQLSENIFFPPARFATSDGLLAIGGDLSIARLTEAYKNGIFPWYNEGQPILWWSPNPRFVLFPKDLKVSKSTKQVIRNKGFKVTLNQDFKGVISNCQKLPRKGQDGTWITADLKKAFLEFQKEGWAHSVEVWQNNELVGGLYGVAMGQVFFGESMFTKVSNASKVGFIKLVEKLAQLNFKLIDCQVYTSHLESLGAKNISGENFTMLLKNLVGDIPQKLNFDE